MSLPRYQNLCDNFVKRFKDEAACEKASRVLAADMPGDGVGHSLRSLDSSMKNGVGKHIARGRASASEVPRQSLRLFVA